VVELGVGCASGNSTKTVCYQDDRGTREVAKNNANGIASSIMSGDDEMRPVMSPSPAARHRKFDDPGG
jgi:hypothetical protein